MTEPYDVSATVKAWAETQSRLWETWVETARAGLTATSPSGHGEHWQEVATQTLEAWASGAGALVDAGSEYFSSVMEDVTGVFEAAAGAATDVNGGLHGPGDVTQRGGGESAFRQVADAWWDNYERTFGRLLTSPSVGYTRELNDKMLESMASWLRFRRASFDYELLLAEAWAKSAEHFARRLASRAEEGDTPTTLRELIRLWTEVTDEVLIDAFGTDHFAEVQGRLVDAAMRYRMHERESVESFLKHSHLPSRSEVDDLARRVHDMRRELRDLRRAMAQKEAPSKKAPSKKAPSKKAPSKKAPTKKEEH